VLEFGGASTVGLKNRVVDASAELSPPASRMSFKVIFGKFDVRSENVLFKSKFRSKPPNIIQIAVWEKG
jgi:hypothetical protein